MVQELGGVRVTQSYFQDLCRGVAWAACRDSRGRLENLHGDTGLNVDGALRLEVEDVDRQEFCTLRRSSGCILELVQRLIVAWR